MVGYDFGNVVEFGVSRLILLRGSERDRSLILVLIDCDVEASRLLALEGRPVLVSVMERLGEGSGVVEPRPSPGGKR